jgi:A/G-specific adenine glycosylase
VPLTEARRLAALRRDLLAWYRRTRRALPWREGAAARDAYAIWVCEIMAQQTQIERVAVYWTRWMARFPTVAALAAAPLDDVLALWAGLGYYARARGLHRAAQIVVAAHAGALLEREDALLALPGVGRYTAGAIRSIAFGRRAAAVDGNVARVLARVCGVEDDVRSPAGQARLWALAGELVPVRGAGDFNQALFDLGATVCTPRAPACASCPWRDGCVARRDGRQADLPLVARRTVVKEVVVESARIVRRGAWLMARRAPQGLYGGLWELPELEAFGADAGLRVERDAVLAEHVHHLSHRRRVHRVYAATLSGAPVLGKPYEATRWVVPHALGELGVSSATLTLAERLGGEGASKQSWPTSKKPRRSSRRDFRASSRG